VPHHTAPHRTAGFSLFLCRPTPGAPDVSHSTVAPAAGPAAAAAAAAILRLATSQGPKSVADDLVRPAPGERADITLGG